MNSFLRMTKAVGVISCLFAFQLFIAASASAVALEKSLDVYQGFSFQRDKMAPVGFITEMRIGSLALGPDTPIVNPESFSSPPVKVVGVLTSFSWQTGVADAIYLSGQISVANKQLLQSMLMSGNTALPVTFNYILFEYDQLRKRYYRSSTGAATLQGLVEKTAQGITLALAPEASFEVQSPQNFSLQIGIKPAAGAAQSISISTGVGKTIAKPWGLAVGR